jgi:hypothetical protein
MTRSLVALLLTVAMAGACASPRLLVHHRATQPGSVDVVVDDVPRGSLAPGDSLGVDVAPGAVRVVVRRPDGVTQTIELWVEGPAEVEIVDDVAAPPETP